jgi:fatty acid desaturase
MRSTLRALHDTNPWVHAKVFLLIGIWGVCAVLATTSGSLLVRLPAWCLIGFALHGIAVFMHEGAHETLFRERLVNRAIGFLCGLPVFFSCSNYRATHLLHHRYENTAKDPDNLDNIPGKFLRGFVYYTWYLVGTPVYILVLIVTGPFRAEGRREKFLCLFETAFMISFYFAVFRLASLYEVWGLLIDGWLMGLPFAMVIANVRGLAEHTMLRHDVPPDPLKATRTTRSTRFISFFFNNQNYHLEHHLFPAMPWNNLPRAHRLLQPIYEARRASVGHGYLQYLRSAFSCGPFRVPNYTTEHRVVVDDDPS